MPEDRPSLLVRLFRGLDGLRRFLVNVLFFGLLVGLAVAAFSGRPKVPDGAALVVHPQGTIVEQLSGGDPVQRLVAESAGVGSAAKETLLKDLVDAIRAAKDDKRIKALYLDLDDMSGAGMTKLRDLRAAIADFKKSGKKVVAYSDGLMQARTTSRPRPTRCTCTREGMVLLEGFGRWRNYYKEGLDRSASTCTSSASASTSRRSSPTSATTCRPRRRRVARALRRPLARLSRRRRRGPQDPARGLTGRDRALPERLRAAGGDTAKMALDAKLVDKLAPRDEVRKRMIELVGEDEETKSFKQVGFADYLKAQGGDRRGAKGKGDAVAVVVAKGDILDGTQPAGTIGGDSTAALIRQAREDEKVKAIVLRVDSPGGSAFASEVIRRECELARRPASRWWSRWAASPPRAATGSRPPPTRSGRPRDDHRLDRHLRHVPDLREAAREVPRRPRGRRRHDALRRRAAAGPRAGPGGGRRDPAVIDQGTRSSSRAWRRPGR